MIVHQAAERADEPVPERSSDRNAPRRARLRRSDLFGVGWIVLISLLFLSPALKDGPSFAPADEGTGLSTLTAGAIPLDTHCAPVPTAPAPATCAHDDENGDQIDQGVPWTNEDWQLVRHGEVPWWDDLEGTGLPQFLNFESAPFALSSLASYLVPLGWAFLVVVWMKLLICGLGAYVLARMLRCRSLAAALGGTTAMLSGAFAAWLGWPQTATLCWAGFIAAGMLWCYREPRRTAPLVLLACSVAFAIYGGFPEGYVLLAIAFVLLFAGAGIALLLGRERPSWLGLWRLALGSVLGLCLGAPLWLPGLSALRDSIRQNEDTALGIASSGTPLLFAQGYDGLPIAGSGFFGKAGLVPNYFETATYLGVVAIVLALVALLVAWRRPAVMGLGIATLGSLLLAYRIGNPGIVQRVVTDVGLGTVNVNRMLILVGFAVALLAAIGAEEVARRDEARVVRRAFVLSVCAVGVVLVVLCARALGGLPAAELALRRASLLWPVASIVCLALVALLLGDKRLLLPDRLRNALAHRRGAALVGVALVGQSAFLLFAGVGINSYARVEFPATAQTNKLDSLVGDNLVALDAGNASVRKWEGTGYYPNMNIGYGIDELALHDPVAPATMFESWPVPNADQLADELNLFAPSVDSVALARSYGAKFILVAAAQPVPAGTDEVAKIGADTLVSVPGAERFVATSAHIVSVTNPGDASYRVTLRAAAKPSTLLAHVTWSPGWSATAEGRSVPLTLTDTAFISVAVPAGATDVTLTYRPPHLDVALALVVLAVLLGIADVLWRRRRSSPARALNAAE